MKAIRFSAITLLLFVAINALAAGYLFISDPSGSRLQIPLSSLKHAPFKDFLIPGIVLFIVNGLFNIIAAAAAILNFKHYPTLIAWQGCILIGWIVIQIIMLQQINFLHIALIIIGLTLFMLGNRLNV